MSFCECFYLVKEVEFYFDISLFVFRHETRKRYPVSGFYQSPEVSRLTFHVTLFSLYSNLSDRPWLFTPRNL